MKLCNSEKVVSGAKEERLHSLYTNGLSDEEMRELGEELKAVI